MTASEILEILKYGEHIHLECKKAETKLPKSIWETYSSFANTDGGVILLGVEENMKEADYSKRFSFVTVSNAAQKIKDFWDTINSDHVSSNILIDENVGTCKINGTEIIWISVPPAGYKYRPIYLDGNPIKGSFKRNHEGDYHCSEDEVKAMLRDASDSGNDDGLLQGYTMEDIDIHALHSYRIEFEHCNPDHIWNGNDDLTFLKNMQGYAIDRNTGKGWLTVAGLLMFGKGLAVRERFDNIRMDFIDQSNLLPGSRWSDRLTYDGMWENNLYNFMRQILPKLVSGLPRPFKLKGMIREDDTSIHKAIREAVVNMIIHSDYMITGILKVVKTDKGYLFSNPGSVKLPIRTIYEGGHSVARNPRIQTFFRMIGIGDNIGSGFPTILNAWNEENWRKPYLCENTELHQVELKLWTISLMPQECTEHLQSLFGLAYSHLNNNSQIILGTAYLEEKVTNSRIQSILDLQSIEIGHILSDLVEKEMLIANKKGRWTSYQLNEEYQVKAEQLNFNDVPNPKIEFKNQTDQLIYEYILENGFITSAQILDITSITTSQGANAALKRLIQSGIIVKIRKGRQFYYQLTN